MAKNFNGSKLPPFVLLDEPYLTFDSLEANAKSIHPLKGLIEHGPFTSHIFSRYTPKIRVAIVGPTSGYNRIVKLMKELQNSHAASDRKEYLPNFPGFEKVFGIAFGSSQSSFHIKWSDALGTSDEFPTQQSVLKDRMLKAIKQLALAKEHFDVAVFHLPDQWDSASRSEDFNAHDHLKSLGAIYQIPTQVINDRAFDFGYKASIAWRLSIAMYVKAGGIPWKLDAIPGVPEGTAYVGLAYALRGNPENAHYVTCCSQVFDMDGGGMEFVAYEARDPVTDLVEARKNPYLSRDDMRAVLARSLQLYQKRNGGKLPKRMVIHKTTAFKDDEINGAHDALAGIPEVECIEISSTSWRGVWLVETGIKERPAKPAKYPIPRGTMMPLSENSALMWIAGNAPDVSSTSDYYQGKKGIPRPLLLTRRSGSGPLDIIAAEALALSKMDWNNDALYDPVPVTITYSKSLARTIASVQELPNQAYPYRLFM